MLHGCARFRPIWWGSGRTQIRLRVVYSREQTNQRVLLLLFLAETRQLSRKIVDGNPVKATTVKPAFENH